MDVGSNRAPGVCQNTRWVFASSIKIEVKNMRTLFDILRKDSEGTFEWLETVNDFETAKARVLQLSLESSGEFVIFRATDLQVVATSHAIEINNDVLRELLEA